MTVRKEMGSASALSQEREKYCGGKVTYSDEGVSISVLRASLVHNS